LIHTGPLVYLGQKYKASKVFGNLFMWGMYSRGGESLFVQGALFTGQPLMVLMYFRNWYLTETSWCPGMNNP
jgi:hypothetical protein